MEAKRAVGKGRVCKNLRCNIRIADQEPCVEVDGNPYHTQCNPLRTAAAVTHCRVGRKLQMPEQLTFRFVM